MAKFCSTEDYDEFMVEEVYPSAAVIVEVDNGWMVFDTQDEFETWKNQK